MDLYRDGEKVEVRDRSADVGERRAESRQRTLSCGLRTTRTEIRVMARPEPEQRPVTDEELERGRARLKEFFDEIAEDLADETGRPVGDFQPDVE
jgi:hypothetical protein